MRVDDTVESVKKTYVKPQLVTHGSVQQMTEGSHKSPPSGGDSGSNVRYPMPFGGKGFLDF